MATDLRNVRVGNRPVSHQQSSTTSRTAGSNSSTGCRVRAILLNTIVGVSLYYAGFMTGMHAFLANDNCSRKLSAALATEEEAVVARLKDPESRAMKRIVDGVVQKRITQGQ